MSQSLYGSICIEDLFGQAIQRDQQGNTWVNLSAFQSSAKNVGKNGKTYVNIGVWINDQTDQYGNIAGISLSQSQEERQQGFKRVYIGNLRPSGQQHAAPVQQQQPVSQTPWGGQPAQPQYAAPQQQPAQQQAYYPAVQQPYGQQGPAAPQAAAPAAPAPAAGTAPYAGNNDLPF